MTAALTPALALDFVTALSADIRAAVVLDASGERLAGPAAFATAARAVLDTPGAQLEGTTATGGIYAVRDERHAIVVVAGRFALARVTRRDLRTALCALGGQTLPDEPSTPLPGPLVNTLLHEFQDGFRRHRAV